MPRMIHPYTRKPVDVPDALVDRYRLSGFVEEKPKSKRKKADDSE